MKFKLSEEDIEGMVQELKRIKEADKAFFQSDRAKDILMQLKTFLDEKGIFDLNPYEDEIFGDVTYDEIEKLIHLMHDTSVSGLIPTIKDECFTEYITIYDNMVFMTVYGQGSDSVVMSRKKYEDVLIGKALVNRGE